MEKLRLGYSNVLGKFDHLAISGKILRIDNMNIYYLAVVAISFKLYFMFSARAKDTLGAEGSQRKA